MVRKTRAFLETIDRLDTFLFLSVGTEETERMKSGNDAMVNLLKELNVSGLDVHYDYTRNADHGNNAYYSTSVALKKWADFYRIAKE